MPRLKPNQVPAYRLHKQSGRAVVTLDGRDVMLGKHGTAESRAAYERIVGEWIANGRRLPASHVPASRSAGTAPPSPAGPTVSMILLGYWKHAQAYYAGSAGELAATKSVLALLRRLYGPTPAAAFGPLALKATRDAMVAAGWCRNYVNAQAKRVRRVFKWAAENEQVPGAAWVALSAVAGLRVGKTTARETAPVQPAPAAAVDAVRAMLSPTVRAMVDLQDLTGMRSTELCTLRTCDVDTTGETWVYRPASHKTQHHGHARAIPVGPRARGILEPLLRADLQAFVFQPADAVAHRHAEAAKRRRTPTGRGNGPGTNRRRKPGRTAGARYTKDSYGQAIDRACERAFPPPPPHLARAAGESVRAWLARLTPEQRDELQAWRRAHRWHPHQLRHGAATRARAAAGVESAQAVLGHSNLKTTEVYAERSLALAADVARRIG